MTNIDTRIIYDANGKPIPQYLDVTDNTDGTAGTMKPITKNSYPEIQDVNVTNQQALPTDYPDSAVKQELELIKAQQQQILDRLDEPIPTQVTGSNVDEGESLPTRKVVNRDITVVADAISIPANQRSPLYFLNPKGASEIYVFASIDTHPWTLEYRNHFGSVISDNGYPSLRNVNQSFSINYPALSLPLGFSNLQGVDAPTTFEEAKNLAIPVSENEYFRIWNYSDETATVTASVIRIWR